MTRRGAGEHRRLTVRLPMAVWAELSRAVADEGGGSMNRVVVQAVSVELVRRRRARVLEQMAKHREEAARRLGVAEDSAPSIRALREGRRADE